MAPNSSDMSVDLASSRNREPRPRTAFNDPLITCETSLRDQSVIEADHITTDREEIQLLGGSLDGVHLGCECRDVSAMGCMKEAIFGPVNLSVSRELML
jgi:hypothetical protein